MSSDRELRDVEMENEPISTQVTRELQAKLTEVQTAPEDEVLAESTKALLVQRDELLAAARSAVNGSELANIPTGPHDGPARVSITYGSFMMLVAAIARAEKGGAH